MSKRFLEPILKIKIPQTIDGMRVIYSRRHPGLNRGIKVLQNTERLLNF
jgi:hypothetical protein